MMALPPDVMPTPEGAPDPEQIGEALIAWALTFPKLELAEVADLAVQVAVEPPEEDPDSEYVQPVWSNRWAITSSGAAEWAMRHLAAAQARQDTLKADRDEYVRQLDVWLAERTRPLEATEEFMRAHLERWGLLMRELTEEATQPLPSGTVRTQQRRTTVGVLKGKVAQAKLVEWAIARGHVEVINPAVYLDALKALVRPVRVVTYKTVCGHTHHAVIDYDEWTPEVFAEGKAALCEHPSHPKAVAAPVMESSVREAVFTHGSEEHPSEEVPCMVVDPAHLTVSVKPS